MESKNYKYDIALSFAGEDRKYVEEVADYLEKYKVKVFYDKYEDLWGKDLYQHLDNVYQNNAKYTAIFISKHYAEKLWTNHELKSAQARAFTENEEYILPIRFDDTEIPGIRRTIGYEDARIITPEQLANKILKKLNKKDEHLVEDNIPIPRIKKKFKDSEREVFIINSFGVILNYFSKALRKFEKSNKRVKTSLVEYSKSKFVSDIIIDNELKSVCKIWIGQDYASNYSILYLESNRELEIGIDNAYNDYSTLEEDGFHLFFKISGMGNFGSSADFINLENASALDLAQYFWKRFIKNII